MFTRMQNLKKSFIIEIDCLSFCFSDHKLQEQFSLFKKEYSLLNIKSGTDVGKLPRRTNRNVFSNRLSLFLNTFVVIGLRKSMRKEEKEKINKAGL